ncbi:MAG TPA: RNA polymerase factor sigma-54 [Gammaproteobacteria bacterium]|nr:RNA polymerase factor sigma-54 [Gammaproteobacteria bacterium]
MKTGLHLRMGQSLALTPQLQQTIRLLQYSTVELQQQVQQMIEQNPLLEMDETAIEPISTGTDAEAPESSETPVVAKEEAELTDLQTRDTIPDELPVDAGWDSIYDSTPVSGSGVDPIEFLENQSGESANLREYLLDQLQLTGLSEPDQLIGEVIIQNLLDTGYLAEPLETVLDILTPYLGNELTLDEVQVVQRMIMQLDPVGCAASDLRESLIAQLHHCVANERVRSAALLLVEHYFPELEKQNIKTLKSRSGLDLPQIEEALVLIRSMNPRPGGGVGGAAPEYISPDVYVVPEKDGWRVSLNPDVSPRLRVHPFYSSLVKRGDKSSENLYIREQMQEARWFIKSIQSRNETILKVARVIVEKQQDFFDKGPEAMRPMVLRDIAETLGMHESTISRVTTHKYMLTPVGLLEFKYFFSSQLDTSDGGNTSATAIRAVIRQLISEENPQKPLSDNKITTILLQKKGIKVARRTVAKYREAMQVPPSNERKRIG